MIDYLRNSLFNIKSDQMNADAIHESVVSGVRLKGAPLIILFCAIIVASVGLNTNSTAVIIGAILIMIPATLSAVYVAAVSIRNDQIYSFSRF